jgi:hypothetical protein
MSETLDTPRSGPCAPWVTMQDVLSEAKRNPTLQGVSIDQGIATDIATVASEVLYALSGRQFTGNCGPVTVRPIARPVDVDTRYGRRGLPSGYLTAGQFASAFGQPGTAAVNSYGTSRPPEVELGAYPVTAIDLVKIDGIVIPPNEYYVRSRRVLVRERPSAGATPTARFGWPVSQLRDLPDTEPGTFSVTYHYGSPPPQSGVRAALVLARQLLLNEYGQDDALPQRVTSISRQGVTMAIVDVMDFFSKGRVGIYEIDLFISTFNSSGAKHRPMVWSPDVGSPVRMPPGR